MEINRRTKLEKKFYGDKYQFVPESLNPAGAVWTIRDIVKMLWPGSNNFFIEAVIQALEIKGSWVPVDVIMPTGQLDNVAKCEFLLRITKGYKS